MRDPDIAKSQWQQVRVVKCPVSGIKVNIVLNIPQHGNTHPHLKSCQAYPYNKSSWICTSDD